MENGNIDRPHFVKSHDFHGDSEYIAWIQEIKTRYQRIPPALHCRQTKGFGVQLAAWTRPCGEKN